MTDRFVEPEIDDSTWEKYFADLRRLGMIKSEETIADASPDSDDDVLVSDFSHITVTTPGHEIFDGWPRGLGTWRNRLLAAGWQVKVGFAECHHDTTYYKSGKVKKPEHDEQQWWLNALKNDKYLTISYTFADGKSVHSSRMVRGVYRLYGDKEMQELVANE